MHMVEDPGHKLITKDDVSGYANYVKIKDEVRVLEDRENELKEKIKEAKSLPEPSPEPESLVGDGRRKYHRSDKGLNTYQINDIMRGWSDYKGCIASDQIDSLNVKLNSRAGFVMNLDPITKEGSHWVAVLVDTRPNGSESVEYYDPLADPPTRRFMSDIRELVSRMEPRDDLMFKTNKIADQSDDTSNCGYFAAKFLIDRFKGKSFAEASGYNARYPEGEKNIELWKESLNIEPFKYLGWTDEEISYAQEGEGIKEVLRDGYKFAKKVGQRIKDVFEGVRKGAPPPVRHWVEKYGTVPISQMKVCRKPIFSIIEKLANWISDGRWEENKKKLSYDRMMHLFVLIKLANGVTIKMEKNHVVEIDNAKWDTDSKTETVPVNVRSNVTVGSLLDKGEKYIGSAEKFWVYDARTQNCQFFIQWCLKGSGLWTTELNKFVMQDAQGVLKDLGYLGKAAKVITDVAGVGDVILNGKGKKKRMRLLRYDD